MLSLTLKFSGYLATSVFLTQFENSSKHDCINACYYNVNCSSFFFKTGTGLCRTEKVVYGNTNSLSGVNNVLYFVFRHAKCPTDYTFYRNTNQCLKLYTNPSTFPDAKVTCERDSGHLIYPKTAERNAHMAAMKQTVWIGGHKVAPDVWEWLDGQPLGPYTNWEPGQPSGNEMAIAAVSSGKWHDFDYTSSFYVICELDIPLVGC